MFGLTTQGLKQALGRFILPLKYLCWTVVYGLLNIKETNTVLIYTLRKVHDQVLSMMLTVVLLHRQVILFKCYFWIEICNTCSWHIIDVKPVPCNAELSTAQSSVKLKVGFLAFVSKVLFLWEAIHVCGAFNLLWHCIMHCLHVWIPAGFQMVPVFFVLLYYVESNACIYIQAMAVRYFMPLSCQSESDHMCYHVQSFWF